jgi:hypothetical protein
MVHHPNVLVTVRVEVDPASIRRRSDVVSMQRNCTMRTWRLSTVALAGALALGGLAAGPGDSEADPPPQAENGCPGIQEAQGEGGGDGEADDTPAADVLQQVEALLDDDNNECEEDAASGENGRP